MLFGKDVIGVFENCTGSNYSFGAAHYPNSGGGANGTFTNCNANNYNEEDVQQDHIQSHSHC